MAVERSQNHHSQNRIQISRIRFGFEFIGVAHPVSVEITGPIAVQRLEIGGFPVVVQAVVIGVS